MALNPLNEHYSFTSPASVYDEEALTALQLAGRTASKVNETVRAFNKLENDTNNHLEDQDAAIAKMNDETMPAKVDQEVQEHIENGDFDRQISEYAGQLDARLNALLGSVTAGTTSMDAEVIDGRMDNYNYTRPNIGASIRAQIFDAFSLANTRVVLGTAKFFSVEYVSGAAKVTFNTKEFSLRKPNESSIQTWVVFTPGSAQESASELENFTMNDAESFTITIPYNATLVYSFLTKKLHIRLENRMQYGDVALLANAYARLYDGALLKESIIKDLEAIKAQLSGSSGEVVTLLRSLTSYFYIGYSVRSIVKSEIGASGSMLVTLPIELAINSYEGNKTIKFSTDTIDTYTVANYVDSMTSDYIVFSMPANSVLSYNLDTKKFGIINVSSLRINTAVLLINNWSILSEGCMLPFFHDQRLLSLETRIKNVEGATNSELVTIDVGRTGEVAALMNTENRFDAFIFATDFHPIDVSYAPEKWGAMVHSYVGHMKKYDDLLPLDFVLTGGDWLTNSTTPDVACHALGVIKGKMRAAFGDRGHMLLGNHDTNYQGKLTPESEWRTGRIPQSVNDRLWYNDRGGKSYYSFDTVNAKYFLFDTGLDWTREVDDYEKGQIQWYIEALKTNDKPFIVITAHMIEVTDNTDMNPMMVTIANIAAAFNTRTTFTFDGVTHDFTNATGKVRLMIGGHAHADRTGAISGVPYILTKNYYDGKSFDFYVIDFDGNTVHLVREGTGADRSLTLYGG